jgi:uncharacterized protein YdhG (YjbR/CyaY superfamily)
MKSKATTPNEYISELPEDRKVVVKRLRKIILDNLPKGFEESMNYGMLGYVVPHSVYPSGYHCNPKMPLPFMNLASQKNHIGFYHMGIYSDPKLLEWFTTEFPKYVPGKLDMGKSCIRFKYDEKIPFDLIGELVSKVSTDEWIQLYEREIKK